MAGHPLVNAFYDRVWNTGERAALDQLVTDDFAFQGSLGPAIVGRDSFWQIVTMVRGALSEYHCTVVTCVSDDAKAFARMRFAGIHTGSFRGHAPSGRRVEWQGAALFQFEAQRIHSLWVISDTAALDAALRAGAD
jgi:steroid delta-isomerase-like uncharacterized protein